MIIIPRNGNEKKVEWNREEENENARNNIGKRAFACAHTISSPSNPSTKVETIKTHTHKREKNVNVECIIIIKIIIQIINNFPQYRAMVIIIMSQLRLLMLLLLFVAVYFHLLF